MTVHRATDGQSQDMIVEVNGRILGACLACDTDEDWVEVIRVEPTKDRPRVPLPTDNFIRYDRLSIPFDVRRKRRPEHWAYWTGSGWVDERSKPIIGPITQILVEQATLGD